ncbi:hypothetical protein BJX66DRAFT_345631 [Aspergillus keveii]|uniref:Uncharacterized protein n=1 Tax=Aspergillus keveii TaxID=714993 RepID=A0ABR4FHU5_9EURO
MTQRIRAFVLTTRARLDTTKVMTIDTDNKNAYMTKIATLNPMKCMCVRICPYENGILSTFASVMAYAPTICIGHKPLVQVLSQVVLSVATKIKNVLDRVHRLKVGQRHDQVHNRNQYKLKIMAIRAFAEMTVNDIFKSFKGAKLNVSYIETLKPAMLQHMNETMPDKLTGYNPGMIVKSRFQWYTYSGKLLLIVIVKETAIV